MRDCISITPCVYFCAVSILCDFCHTTICYPICTIFVVVALLLPFTQPARFDVDAEIDFIDAMAAERRIVAIGECGLDKFYLTDDVSMAEQERVLRKLMRVSRCTKDKI